MEAEIVFGEEGIGGARNLLDVLSERIRKSVMRRDCCKGLFGFVFFLFGFGFSGGGHVGALGIGD